ncbi:hypothetical protein AX17_005407 [Amanita inopinata Kibby_2008]|nr:hypothetical protein AX17_005407 [Amanita inopinata Kibby_2008]
MYLDPSFLVRSATGTTLNNNAAFTIRPSDCKDIDHCRTLQSIVLGSVSTIFLCTWVALHLNIPRDPKNPGRFRRLWFMLGALVGPEVVFSFAFSDWVDGCDMLRQILEKHPECTWTEIHAQFAQMGGFQLVHTDGTKEQMHGKEFFDRVLEDSIDIPDITEDEIIDRSKGDAIAKAIVVLQTTWFVVQCAHRVSQGLTVTELEITALGHTAMNLLVYWCWWNKPLDIRFPINVPEKQSESKEEPVVETDTAPVDDGASRIERENAETGDALETNDEDLHSQPSDDGERADNSSVSPGDAEANSGRQETDNEPASERVTSPRASDDGEANGEQAERDALLSHTPESNDKEGEGVKSDIESIKSSASRRFSPRFRLALYISKRYESKVLKYELFWCAFLFVVGGLFGVIHCLAWNSQFPTPAERIIWRVSSLLVTFISGLVFTVAIFGPDDDPTWLTWENWTFPVILLFVMAYCVARICLLVIAFLTLRFLPHKAYVSPSWTSFFPHV